MVTVASLEVSYQGGFGGLSHSSVEAFKIQLSAT